MFPSRHCWTPPLLYCEGWISLLAPGSISPMLALGSWMLPVEPLLWCCTRRLCPWMRVNCFAKPLVTIG